jgi:excisionase family DNA binding protein
MDGSGEILQLKSNPAGWASGIGICGALDFHGSRSAPISECVMSKKSECTVAQMYETFCEFSGKQQTEFLSLVRQEAESGSPGGPKYWMTPDEAAESLEVSRQTIWRAVRDGRLLTDGKTRNRRRILVFCVIEMMLKQLEMLTKSLEVANGNNDPVRNALEKLKVCQDWNKKNLDLWRAKLLAGQRRPNLKKGRI